MSASAAQIAQNNEYLVPAAWPKGVSGNPGGRPRAARSPSAALAELNDTEGDDLDEQVANFKRKRGTKFCGADSKAIAITRAAANVEHRAMVQAFAETTDRLEGPVPKAVDLRTSATLTICVVPFEALVSGFHSPQAALEAQVELVAADESATP